VHNSRSPLHLLKKRIEKWSLNDRISNYDKISHISHRYCFLSQFKIICSTLQIQMLITTILTSLPLITKTKQTNHHNRFRVNKKYTNIKYTTRHPFILALCKIFRNCNLIMGSFVFALDLLYSVILYLFNVIKKWHSTT